MPPKRQKLEGPNRESLVARSLGVLRLETRTALSSSDIPLPTQYSGEVVALVGMFGTARKYGTVFPLGAATVKLPKLKTDPTFGLLAQSTAITEKSPQTEWVTFTPEKFGGLVRMPNELDADSIVDLGRFIAEYAARQFAYSEDWNFWRSTGAASGVNGTAEGLTKSVATDSKPGMPAWTRLGIFQLMPLNHPGPKGIFIGMAGVPSGLTFRSETCFFSRVRP